MANKKQPAKKRIYVKKSAKWTRKDSISARNIESLILPTEPAAQMDTEIQSLAAICSIFDNWDTEQKQRNLKYLASRYYDFL